MGMYTEIFFRANVDPKLTEFLQKWKAGEYDWTFRLVDAPFDHEFFKCSRWATLMSQNDSYFPYAYGSAVDMQFPQTPSLALHTCIKNYDSEYGKFFDWIAPYIDEPEGKFIGYTLYEEDNVPTMYYSDGVGYDRIWRERSQARKSTDGLT